MHFANTSDTLAVIVDGDVKAVFDDNQFCALLDLYEQKPEDSFWPDDKNPVYRPAAAK